MKHEKNSCGDEETAANWAARQESASAEMAAINKAIEVLSEGVRVLLQTKSSKRSRNVMIRRRRTSASRPIDKRGVAALPRDGSAQQPTCHMHGPPKARED